MRHKPPGKPSANKTHDCAAPSASEFVSGDSAALLAAFGPPNPPAGMVRVVKDVLHVGRWHTAAGVWDVTREKLAKIAANFAARLGRGNAVNLVNTHGDQSGVVHPRDIITQIDAAAVIGDTLWISAYVTPDDAASLKRSGIKVSVRGAEQWRDGDGIECGPCLLHVAVVDLPVIGRQGRFKDLAQGGRMDPMIEALNMLLEAVGLAPLPEGTEAAALPELLKGIAIGMGAEAAEEPAAAEETVEDVPVIDETGGDGAAAEPMLAALQKQVKDLSAQVAASQLAGRQAAFNLVVSQLGAAGVPAASLTKAREVAAKSGFDLSVLEPLKALPKIDMSRQARRHASGDAPAGTEPKKRTAEELKEMAKAFR